MKLRKKYAVIIAAAIMATSVPVFGESVNSVNKIVTVAQNSELEEVLAPEIKIQLKDDLKKGNVFYLHLEDAKWADDIVAQLGTNLNFEFSRANHKTLEVEAKRNIPASTTVYGIPLITTVTGERAKVKVESNDTVITSDEHTFALTNNSKSRITAEVPQGFALKGEMAKITIEEQYIRGFKSSQPQFLRVRLNTRGIEFNHDVGTVLTGALKGSRAYAGKTYDVKVIDSTTLEVKIPANSLDKTQRGSLELSGIGLKAVNNAEFGRVEASLSGDLGYEEALIVGQYSDYGIELKVAKEYSLVAGQQLKDIEFTLRETAPNSLSGGRETYFTFPEDVTIDKVVVSNTDGLTLGKTPTIAIDQKDNKNTNLFTVNNIHTNQNENASITFKATLNVPADFSETINLTVEGTSFEETKEVLIASVKSPVTVKIQPARVKVGLAQQIGGTIILTETDKETISKGKIFFALAHEHMQYTKAPEAKVIKGDLVLDGDVEIAKGGLELTVGRQSMKASTIEISGGEIRVDRMIADGNYEVEVGGPALSVYSSKTLWNDADDKQNDIAPIVKENFIIAGTAERSEEAIFIIGKGKYTVNGEVKTMDTVPYLAKEGRTMLPVRYAADALGIDPTQILWDDESKTVTVMGNDSKVVQIELGSKEMIINLATVPMSAAAEMKNNRIFIPVAEIARALDSLVVWDSETQTVNFN